MLSDCCKKLLQPSGEPNIGSAENGCKVDLIFLLCFDSVIKICNHTRAAKFFCQFESSFRPAPDMSETELLLKNSSAPHIGQFGK